MPSDEDPRSKPPHGPSLPKETIDAMKRQVVHGVGYGNPPEHSRFQKGQSGNPKGRPPAKTRAEASFEMLPIQEKILEEMKRPVRMRDGGTVTDVPADEALVRAILASALKGNSRAQALALDHLKNAERAQAFKVRKSMEWATEYKEKANYAIQAAISAGKPPPEFLPHPDDIILDDKHGYRIVGPIDENEQKKLQQTLKLRDVLLLQDVLDQRLETLGAFARERPGDRPGGARLFAMVMDNMVPVRFRLSETEQIYRYMRDDRFSKRDLFKIVHQAWKEVGMPFPRGFAFLGLLAIKRMIQFTFAFKAAVDKGDIDLEAACRGEFDAGARRFLESWGCRLSSSGETLTP